MYGQLNTFEAYEKEKCEDSVYMYCVILVKPINSVPHIQYIQVQSILL